VDVEDGPIEEECGTLPRADKARIDPAKLRDYLLSPTHPVGSCKATFFFRLGYTQVDWPSLEDDLRLLIGVEPALRAAQSEHGRKYEVRGTLAGPNGREARVVTVWILGEEGDPPRFITAYPETDA
jgi:hypothetical protein